MQIRNKMAPRGFGRRLGFTHRDMARHALTGALALTGLTIEFASAPGMSKQLR